jgi:hypothetical protein
MFIYLKQQTHESQLSKHMASYQLLISTNTHSLWTTKEAKDLHLGVKIKIHDKVTLTYS